MSVGLRMLHCSRLSELVSPGRRFLGEVLEDLLQANRQEFQWRRRVSEWVDQPRDANFGLGFGPMKLHSLTFAATFLANVGATRKRVD